MAEVDLAPNRLALQRVATHVLARRRHAVTGRFGLRATPGGFGTPAFGPDHEVLRVAGTDLVRETGATAATIPIAGSTLAGLAAFAEADLDAEFSAGHDTPAVGAPDEPLAVAPVAAAVLADWFALGWRALDTVVAGLGPSARPTVVQLWPEHFDAGCAIAVGPDDGDRCNLGASPGDAGSGDEPYLYVGPWGPERPGDPSYWNAPFGAVLRRAEVVAAPDPLAAAVAFLRRGVDLQLGPRPRS